MTDETPRIGRRRLLASLGVAGAGGLAGCPSVTINIGDDGGGGSGGGGGGSNGGDGGGSNGGDGGGGDGDGGLLGDGDDGGGNGDGSGGSDGGASGDVSCTDASNGYERMDVGNRPVIFDFDYPAIFDEPVYTRSGPVALFEVDRTTANGGVITIKVNQGISPEYTVGEVETQGANIVTTTFNGEEVDFFGVTSGNEMSIAADLPYQIDGQRETLFATFSLSISEVDSNECGDALRAAGERFAESLEVNPETTIESEVDSG